jgi:hypothetical protein
MSAPRQAAICDAAKAGLANLSAEPDSLVVHEDLQLATADRSRLYERSVSFTRVVLLSLQTIRPSDATRGTQPDALIEIAALEAYCQYSSRTIFL